MARDLVLEVITKSRNEALRETARELDHTADSTDRLGKSSKGLSDQLPIIPGRSHEVTRALEEQGRSTKLLEKITADARAELKRLEEQLATTGDVTLTKGITSQRSLIARLEKVAKDLAPQAGSGGGVVPPIVSSVGGVLDSFKGLPIGPMAIASLVGAAVAAAPVMGGIIGGAVAAGVGTIGVVGGILAARNDPRVKAAEHLFGQEFAAAMRVAGKPMVQPILEGLNELQGTVNRLDLGRTFAIAAPYVKDLADGIDAFATKFMPGFDKALEEARPVMTELVTDLGGLGNALGWSSERLASGSGNVEGLRIAFGLLDGALMVTSNFIHNLSTVLDVSTRGIYILSAAGVQLSGAFAPIRDILSLLVTNGQQGAAVVHGLNGHFADLSTSGLTVNQVFVSVARTFQDLITSTEAAAKATNDLIAASQKYESEQLGVKSANLAVKQDMIDLKDAFKQGTFGLSDFTQAGINHQKMLVDTAADYERQREQTIALTNDVDGANRTYQAQIKALEVLAIKNGANAKQVHALLDSLLKIPARVSSEIDIKVKVHEFDSITSSGERHGADVSHAVATAVTTNVAKQFAPARATGGPVWPGQTYWVGERGPEPFVPLVPGRIGTAGSATTAGRTQVAVTVSANGLNDALATWLKGAVRAEGGVDNFFGERR